MRKLLLLFSTYAITLLIIANIAPQAIASPSQTPSFTRTLKDIIVEGLTTCKNEEAQTNPADLNTAYKTCLKNKIIAFIKERSRQNEVIKDIAKAGLGKNFIDIENYTGADRKFSPSDIRAHLLDLTIIDGKYAEAVTGNGIIYGGKKDDTWQFIFSQEPVDCAENFLKTFPDFPATFIEECYDSVREEKIPRL